MKLLATIMLFVWAFAPMQAQTTKLVFSKNEYKAVFSSNLMMVVLNHHSRVHETQTKITILESEGRIHVHDRDCEIENPESTKEDSGHDEKIAVKEILPYTHRQVQIHYILEREGRFIVKLHDGEIYEIVYVIPGMNIIYTNKQI